MYDQRPQEDVRVPKNNKNSLISIAAAFAVLLLLVSYIVALTKFVDEDFVQEQSSGVDVSQESFGVESSNVSETSQSQSEYKYYDSLQLQEQPFSNSGVVNGSVALIDASNYPTVDQEKIVNIYSNRVGKVYGLSNTSLVLYEEALRAIDAFIVSFYDQVPSNGLIIDKGYMRPEMISAEDVKIDLTSGYSVQFAINSSPYKFSDSEFGYLRDQAYKYGVIQRYPSDKESFTGHSGNNTVYRYVGVAHSSYMNHYNLSLEEYIDKVRTNKVLEFESEIESGVAYVIYYVELDEQVGTTYVPVPADGEYSISGDGSDGYIVSVKVSVQ